MPAKSDAIELTRIYQGRVEKIFKNGTGLSYEEGLELVWKHHELFQDAVNYYLLALAGMADIEKDSAVSRMRRSMEMVWEDFTRNGVKRPGMKHSIARTLDCSPDSLTIQEAIDRILGEPLAGKVAWDIAVNQIAASCEGEGEVTQQKRMVLAQLCSKKYDGNFFFGETMAAGREGLRIMKALFLEEDTESLEENLNEVQKRIQFSWVGIKNQEKAYSENEFRELLKKAIHYFKTISPSNSSEKFAKDALDPEKPDMYLERVESVVRDDIKRVSSGRKPSVVLFNACILFMAFGDLHSFNLIKTQVKTIDRKIREWGDGLPGECGLDGDPIELSRGDRGYVFKQFTALPGWKQVWKEFDFESIAEALKTLNQFRGKESERQAELDSVKACLDWMSRGISKDGKPVRAYETDGVVNCEEDDASSSFLPTFKDDIRWERLQCILREHLAVKNDFTNDELMDYGLSERTIRGSKEIFRRWNEVIEGANSAEDRISCVYKLRKILVDFQTDNPKTIGSAPLFNELLKPENFCIWESRFTINGKYSSKNILEDAVLFFYYRDRAEQLEEPIKCTPADARHSRRLCNLQALAGLAQGKGGGRKKTVWPRGYGIRERNILAVALVVKGDGGLWSKEKVEMRFSAPRIRRDQLVSRGVSEYCPPLAQALSGLGVDGMPCDGQETISPQIGEAAVQLMPDYDRKNHLRILLNFQPSIDVTDIQRIAGEFFDRYQFYGGDEKFGLRWPDYDEKNPVKWCNNPTPFNVVSVDLGQRTCGALSRIEVSPEKQEHSIFVGSDGSRDWFARRTYSQLLRLNGEDCRTSEGREELSGSAGRLARPEETDEAKEICVALVGKEKMMDFLVKTIDSTGGLVFEKYFPAQNDKLLRAFKMALGHLRSLARWHYFMGEGRDADVAEEIKAADWLGDKSLMGVENFENKMREELPKLLLQITERILPLRGRHWELVYRNGQYGGFELSQTIPSASEPRRWICGQRGLSFARLEQLETLRKNFQSLNRICMDKPGSKRKTSRELRGISIPDCCPDVLNRLDELKTQRVNQTANLILAHALGMRRRAHDLSTRQCRIEDNIHGEYERIPGVAPAKFIVIENLSRYRFSQGRAKFENSRLMKWSHRAVRDKLVQLCEVFGISVVEVNASYSSRFTPDGVPGFRAEEVPANQVLGSWSIKSLEKKEDFSREYEEYCRIVGLARGMGKTVLVPKEGGSIFVPFVSRNGDSRHLEQADLNASYNIGLRGIAHRGNLSVHNKVTIKRVKSVWRPILASKVLKKVIPKNSVLNIEETSMDKKDVINLFAIGCPCRSIGLSSAMSEDSPFAEYNGRLLVGTAVFRNRHAELARCISINRMRLGV